jgi:hypothetical protein
MQEGQAFSHAFSHLLPSPSSTLALTLPNPQVAQDIPRYVPIAADYCRSIPGGRGAGIGDGYAAGGAFLASVTTRFLRDEAGRIREVGWGRRLNDIQRSFDQCILSFRWARICI